MAIQPKKRSLLFRKYPNTDYTLFGNTESVKNILIRAKIKDIVLQNARIFYEYDMADGDTAEMIAHKYYDDVNLHWIVLMTNLHLDGRFDIGVNYETFQKFLINKYPGIVLNTNNFSGDIAIGSTITGNVSGAKGEVVDWNPSTGRIAIVETSGDFQKGESADTIMIRGDDVLEGQMQFGQYKIAHTHATHHYENTITGDLLDVEQFFETPVSDRREVSNIVYEQELNQVKRKIRLIKPEYVQSIVDEMTTVLKQNRVAV